MKENHPGAIKVSGHKLQFLNFIMASALLLAGILPLQSRYAYAATDPLQIGWYTSVCISDLTRIDRQKAAGQTLMVADYCNAPLPYMTKLQQTNIKAFFELDPVAVKAGDTAALTSFVNTYKNNPVVVGWYLFDEPEFNNIPPSTLVTDYQAIKSADPNHPVAVCHGDGYCSYVAHIYGNQFNYADVIMFDQYPIHDQSEFGATVPNGHYNFTDVAEEVNDCMAFLGTLGKGFITIIQGFNWGGIGPSGQPCRNPTYGEERYFTFMPFISNVEGIVFWVDYRASDTLTAIIDSCIKEASSVGSALVNGVHNDPSVSVSSKAVSYKYGSDSAHTYLIAENDSASSITATFTLPASVTASSVTVLYDGYNASTKAYQSRSIQTSTSSGRPTFSDAFTKYQVNISQFARPAGTIEKRPENLRPVTEPRVMIADMQKYQTLKLQVFLPQSGQYAVDIYDVQGKRVWHQANSTWAGGAHLTIGRLCGGIYTARLMYGGTQTSMHFLVAY